MSIFESTQSVTPLIREIGRYGDFDYADVKPSVANFLRGQAERIRKHFSSSVIQVGKALMESKRHLSHGEFLAWVEHEVGIPARSAQNYMRVAIWAKGKSETVSHLPPTVLYILSKTGVPKDFVVEILESVEAGERLAPSAIKRKLKSFRSSKLASSSGIESQAHEYWSNEPAKDAPSMTNADDQLINLIAELVATLAQGLSKADFERVREIVTSDAVLSNPGFVVTLYKAFGRARC